MSHGGKGDTPRPFSVNTNTFASNWEATFGKKNNKVADEIVDDYDRETKEYLPRDSEQDG